MSNTNPSDTISLIRQLQKLGFGDAAFCRLHHFRDNRPETIDNFITYCAKIGTFQRNGSNSRVHDRLEWVLSHCGPTSLADRDPMEFVKLAEASVREIPF